MKPISPTLAVGAIVFHNGHVLLVKRAKPPCQGQWAVPGGKVREGETLAQACEREILEETSVRVKAGKPVYKFELTETTDDKLDYHFLIYDLEAEYVVGNPAARDDTLEVRWISKREIVKLNLNSDTGNLLKTVYQFY